MPFGPRIKIIATLLLTLPATAFAIDIPFMRGYLTGCTETYDLTAHSLDPDFNLIDRGAGNEDVLFTILSTQKIKNRRLAHNGFDADVTQVFYLNEILAMTTGKIPGGAWNRADFLHRMFEIIRFVWNLDSTTPDLYLFFQVEKTAKEITHQYPELKNLEMPANSTEKEAQVWYKEQLKQWGRALVLVRDASQTSPTQQEILDSTAEGLISRGIGMITMSKGKIVDAITPPDLSWIDDPNVERINPIYPIANERFDHAMGNLSWELSGNADFGPIVVEALGLLKSDEDRLWLINAIYQFWKSDPTIGFVADLSTSKLSYNKEKKVSETIPLKAAEVEKKFATLKKNLVQWIEMQQSWTSGRYQNDWGNDEKSAARFISR